MTLYQSCYRRLKCIFNLSGVIYSYILKKITKSTKLMTRCVDLKFIAILDQTLTISAPFSYGTSIANKCRLGIFNFNLYMGIFNFHIHCIQLILYFSIQFCTQNIGAQRETRTSTILGLIVS